MQDRKLNGIFSNGAKDKAKSHALTLSVPSNPGNGCWGMHTRGAVKLHNLFTEPPQCADIFHRSLIKSGTQWPSYSDELQRFLQRWNWNRAGSNLSERDDHLTLILRLCSSNTQRQVTEEGKRRSWFISVPGAPWLKWQPNPCFYKRLVKTEKLVDIENALCFPVSSPKSFAKTLLSWVTVKVEWKERKMVSTYKITPQFSALIWRKRGPKNTYTLSFMKLFSTFTHHMKVLRSNKASNW